MPGAPLSIHIAPSRDDLSERVAALERSDNVVSRPATLSLRSSAATVAGHSVAVAAA